MQQTRLKGPWPTAKHSARADLIASQVVPILLQQLGYLLYVDSVVEGGGVTDLPLVGGHLALQALNQVTNGHTRWNGVRVDDDVRGDALARERHVLDKPRSNQAWTPQALLAFRTSINTMSAIGTEKKDRRKDFWEGNLQTRLCTSIFSLDAFTPTTYYFEILVLPTTTFISSRFLFYALTLWTTTMSTSYVWQRLSTADSESSRPVPFWYSTHVTPHPVSVRPR